MLMCVALVVLASLAKRAYGLVPDAAPCAKVEAYADEALEVGGSVSVVADSIERVCATVARGAE